ncbi:MAG: 2-oxoacid:acceptor oxidoreductase family protein [Deltaproteobacteria bacterium]|nr:2-oxoacid:acceptor oxidoreductase family protein [Deltaproteobacteria bacterium]
MMEIRFHGRGGQGTVVGTILLAKAFFEAGKHVQTFPLFGVERRGAPVEAFLRLDTEEILVRTNVYTPDHVVVQDATLLSGIDVTRGLKKNGLILVNSPREPAEIKKFSGFSFAYVDASRIALDYGLGTRTHPIVNTSMIGAFARAFGEPPLEAIAHAICEDITSKHEGNIKASERAYSEVVMLGIIE